MPDAIIHYVDHGTQLTPKPKAHLFYEGENGVVRDKYLENSGVPGIGIFAKICPNAAAKILDFVDGITPDFSGGNWGCWA